MYTSTTVFSIGRRTVNFADCISCLRHMNRNRTKTIVGYLLFVHAPPPPRLPPATPTGMKYNGLEPLPWYFVSQYLCRTHSENDAHACEHSVLSFNSSP